MASQTGRLTVDASSQAQRARRIPDQEWEIWREKLVKLYVEEDVSRKEIIDIMAKEHDFVITGTQLKHRFAKWDVKKYIKDDDMAIILSLRRKRQAKGKNIQIQYKGHTVEQERIERAFKRRKGPLLSPTFIPSYIKINRSRHQSPRWPADDVSNGRNITGDGIGILNSRDLDSNSYVMQRSDFPLNPMPSLNSAMDMDFTFPHGVDSAKAIAQMNDRIMVDAPDVAVVESIETDKQTNLFQTCNLEHTYHNTEMGQLSNELFPGGSPAKMSRRSSVRLSDSDWQAVINWSPSMRSSIGASGSIVGRANRSLPKSPTIRSKSILCDQDFTNNGISKRLDSLGRILPPNIDAEIPYIHPIISEGTDPTTLNLPLELIKSHLTKCFYPPAHAKHSSTSILGNLSRDRWLELELEDLLCWSCESFVKAVRKLRSIMKGRNDLLDGENDNSSKSQKSSSLSGRANGKSWSESNPQVRSTEYSLSFSRAGVLRATLGTLPNEETDSNTSDGFLILDLAFMPTENERTRGISVTFVRTVNEFAGPRISPYIKVFNVVPDDSEIMVCVSRNDLLGIQKLFEKGEASPTDVDKLGFSLLSYAIHYGYSDVFKLLLQAGADTQNCNSCNNTLDLIWTIWGDFDDIQSGARLGDYPVEYLGNFNQCVSMTDAALRHGCDIDNSVPYNPYFPNPLFAIIETKTFPDTDAPASAREASAHEKALKYLLKTGYDMEQQKNQGLTPLLCAATVLIPPVIKFLKILVEKGAGIHAVDARGRGALHCAFAEPQCCGETLASSCPEFDSWEIMSCYGTNDEGYAEDYSDLNHDLEPLVQNDSTVGHAPSNDSLLDTQNRDHESKLDCQVSSYMCDRHRTSDSNASRGKREAYLICGYQNLDDLPATGHFIADPNSAHNFQHNVFAEEPDACTHTGSEADNLYFCSSNEDRGSDDHEIDWIIGKGDDNQYHWIRDPKQVFKKRIRFKLLFLLKAGCDPNVLDNEGKSPSDYARRDCLWPQWKWALHNAGYIYDAFKDGWVRRVQGEIL